MTVERGGKIFTVAYETEDEVCVEAEIDFYPDTKKTLLLVWSKTECRFIKERQAKGEEVKA